VLLPRCWVVERSFARMVRFRWLARDYERLLAFSILLAVKFLVVYSFLASSSPMDQQEYIYRAAASDPATKGWRASWGVGRYYPLG